MFACIYIPDFSVQAVCRQTANMNLQARVAVVDGPASLLRIVALNPRASEAGLQIGMTKSQAAACDDVNVIARSATAEELTQAALLECAADFSPRVESTSPGIVTLDLTGMEKLFPSEAAIAQAITRSAEVIGICVHIGIAADPDTAMHVAYGNADITVVARGKEAEVLSKLPLTVLCPSAEMLEILEQMGIRTCGQLAALPENGIAERFGEAGIQLWRRAKGSCRRVLVPFTPAREFSATCELEESVELLPTLMHWVSELLDQVVASAKQFALAVLSIELKAELEVYADFDVNAGPQEDGTAATHAVALALPTPSQDAVSLAKLLELELAAHPPAAPVKRLHLLAITAKPRSLQPGLFCAVRPEPEKLEITLARIREVVGGQERVGSPQLVDLHRPDSFTIGVFPGSSAAKQTSMASEARMCLRRFRPPVPAQVDLREGVPWSVAFHNRRWPVLMASGPWRGSGEWWDRASAWLRNDWHLGLASANGFAVYSVHEDMLTHSWFVNGYFD
jgi:protein ImuB